MPSKKVPKQAPKEPEKRHYKDMEVPKGKSKKKYTPTERRTHLFKLIEETLNIDDVSPTKHSKEFGVSVAAIGNDKNVLRAYLTEVLLNKDNIIGEIVTNKRWALRQARKEVDVKEVNKITDSTLQMAHDLGVIDKNSETLKLEGDAFKIIVNYPKKKKKD